MMEGLAATTHERAVLKSFEKKELTLDSLPTATKAHALAIPLCQREHMSDPEQAELLSTLKGEHLVKEEVRLTDEKRLIGEESLPPPQENSTEIEEEAIDLFSKNEDDELFSERFSNPDQIRSRPSAQREQRTKEVSIAFVKNEKETQKKEREAEPVRELSNSRAPEVKKEAEKTMRIYAHHLEQRISFAEKVLLPTSHKKGALMHLLNKTESSKAKKEDRDQVALTLTVGQREIIVPPPKELPRFKKEERERQQGEQQKQQQEQEKERPKKEKKRKIEAIEKSEGSTLREESAPEREEALSRDEIKEELLRALKEKEPTLGEGVAEEGLSALLAEQEPTLSKFLQLPVTYLDILYLYAKILKLMIEGKKQERVSRHEERVLQIQYMEDVVSNFKKTASWLFTAGLTGGLLGLASGILPILGHTKFGEGTLNLLKNAFKTLASQKPEGFFQSAGKIASTMSQMQTEMGNVQRTNAEADRFRSQHLTDLRRADSEENTRGIEDIKQEYRTALQVMSELLRMIYEAATAVHGR